MVVPILQGPLRGKKWIAGSGTHGCWLGTYELAAQNLFRRIVKPGDVIYDIGANVGFYTLLSSICAGPTGKVYSFEPLPQNIAELRKHITMNRLSNCELIEAAVSHSDGTARFDSSRPRSMGQVSARGNKFVRTVRIDSLVDGKRILPPNVLKIDVEGEEFNVLRGAQGTLGEYSPVIFLETHGTEARESCMQFLTERQYTITSLNSRNVECSDELIAFKGELSRQDCI